MLRSVLCEKNGLTVERDVLRPILTVNVDLERGARCATFCVVWKKTGLTVERGVELSTSFERGAILAGRSRRVRVFRGFQRLTLI